MKRITIVGLGSGDWDGLPLGTYKQLREAEEIWLRTEQHPVVKWLVNEGVRYRSFDEIYEQEADFSAVYRRIVDHLLAEAAAGKQVVYAVPGHPMVAERTVQLLLQEGEAQGISIDLRGGGSFLDTSFARLQIDPIEGFQLLDGTAIQAAQINPQLHIIIGQVYDRMVASDVKLTLMEIYPDETPITVASALGVEGAERIRSLPLFELDRVEDLDDLTLVYLEPTHNPAILRRRFDTLTAIIAQLRGPDGCPWDRKQTHQTLRPYLLEEAYEFLAAVADEDPEAMAEELGDVLLQVVLHAQIAQEEATFDLGDVIGGLVEKLIRRHPHVFGENKGADIESVQVKWEEIKEEERAKRGEKRRSLMDGVEQYPALLRAHEIKKRASSVGFDWERKEEVREKIMEELDELFRASPDEQEGELGDVLISVVALASFFDVDPEQALLASCHKFIQRFGYIEEQARATKRALTDLSLEEMDAWWDEAKTLEK